MNFDIKSFFSKRENIVSTILVSAVIIFIAFLFPTSARFNLDYTKGEIWRHEDLLAPFEFSVVKNPQEVQKLKRQVRQELFLRFERTGKENKVDVQLQNFLDEIKSELSTDKFQKIDRYLNINKNKIIVNKDDLVLDGVQKSSILLPEEEGLKKYGPDRIVDIKDVYSFLENELPKEHHDELSKLLTIEAELDKNRTQEALAKVEANVLKSDNTVKNGELIVSKGNLISANVYQKLISLEEAFAKQETTFSKGAGSFLGHIILTFLILSALMLYLYFHFPHILETPKELGFILLWIVIFTFLVYQIERTPNLSAYMIPFCIAPIVIKTYYEERLALFVHIVIVLIASFLSTLDYEFTFLQILAGIVTVLLIEETRYWDRFFVSILIIMATYYLGFWGLHMASTNTLGAGLDSSILKWLGVNTVLILLAYPIIPLFSKLFGFTSNITLVELADLNMPLLKNLSINAPGTFQHSLQVANLAEAAAEKIGADSLLIKVAALYHDVGKLEEPMIFIENQGYGRNPHEDLSYFDSARKIINHIPAGVKMGVTNRLPKEIVRMIKTHHGTTRVEYFYRKQLEDFPEREFDESVFRYDGPKPETKEESILMLADSIEASSKSLKNPSAKEIDNLVDKIVVQKVRNNQLSESKLTYEEMVVCKDIFKDLLKSINHVRIQYPEEKSQKA